MLVLASVQTELTNVHQSVVCVVLFVGVALTCPPGLCDFSVFLCCRLMLTASG